MVTDHPDKILKLHAKAASTEQVGFPGEARLLRDKAKELSWRYGFTWEDFARREEMDFDLAPLSADTAAWVVAETQALRARTRWVDEQARRAADSRRRIQHFCNGTEPAAGRVADCPACAHHEAPRAEAQALRDKEDDAALLADLVSAPERFDDEDVEGLRVRGYDVYTRGRRFGRMPTWRKRLHALAWGDERADRRVNVPMGTPMAPGVPDWVARPWLSKVQWWRFRAQMAERRALLGHPGASLWESGLADLYEPLFWIAEHARKLQRTDPVGDYVLGRVWVAALSHRETVLGPDGKPVLGPRDVLYCDRPLLYREAWQALNLYRRKEEVGPVPVPDWAARANSKGKAGPHIADAVERTRRIGPLGGDADADWDPKWGTGWMPDWGTRVDGDAVADGDMLDAGGLPSPSDMDAQSVLDALEPRARLIVLMRGDDYSDAAIGRALGVTPKVARRLIGKALTEAEKLCEAAGIAPSGDAP